MNANLALILVLQILVSGFYFSNKVLIYKGRKVGWLMGALAATLAVLYFSLLHRYVYIILNVGLIILMGYGFLKKNKTSPNVEMLIRLVTIVVMVILTFSAWSGLTTAVELVSSVGLFIGTFFLTHNRAKTGWILYCVGHATAIHIGYCTHQWIFLVSQIASVIVSILAIKKISKQTLPA